jgi:hypothetical protein
MWFQCEQSLGFFLIPTKVIHLYYFRTSSISYCEGDAAGMRYSYFLHKYLCIQLLQIIP